MNEQLNVDRQDKTNITKAHKGEHPQFVFRPLTIQQRLPLFICLLLTAIVVLFSWLSYLGVKDAGMAAGNERVTTLVNKLGVMFKGSVDKFAASTTLIAREPVVKEYLVSHGEETRIKTVAILNDFLKKDTTNKSVELLNDRKQVVLQSGDIGLPAAPDILWMKPVHVKKEFSDVGRIITQNGEMYFPVLSSVAEQNNVIGYVVNWKHLKATQQSIDQFGQLLGGNGKLYFGNDDGRFWTNLIRPVSSPPVNLAQLQKVMTYSRKAGEPLLGSAKKISDSHWVMLVELSAASFQGTANIFLRRVAAIGCLLIICGGIGAWLMSKSITKPIKQLGMAASAISDGNYSLLVHIDRHDELGTLAESFNIMAVRVRAAQENLEQKVEQTSKELLTAITDAQYQKEVEEKKDEFISIASHELKTPLTTLKAFFQLAAKELPIDSKPFSLIGTASRQLGRMERLINDLLDVSKINAGKMQYNFSEFDFQNLLNEVINSVQEIYPSHRLVLKNATPVTVTADRNRIEQVIVNLLTNAIKYSPGKDIVLIRSEVKNRYLLVSIEDFGIGIEQKHIGDLFDRFHRINNDHRFQGLGLGLFISDEIIKRHGGKIDVKSEPGKGSVFTLLLPLKINENKS